jgi:hypothetical protein
MELVFFRLWGHDHLIVASEWLQRHCESLSWLLEYELLDLPHAARVLAHMARVDPCFVGQLARDVLPGFSGVHASSECQHQLLDGLMLALGSRFSKPGEPPRFARFHICALKRSDGVPVPLPDPWRDAREAFERVKRAPRSFVVVEAVTDSGQPVPNLTLEVLLADAETQTRCTDAFGLLRLEPIPPGMCHIRVPHLDAEAWRPGEGDASALVDRKRTRRHLVARGEGLSRIAKQYGVADWKKIWDAPENQALRKQRKHPNLLRPGDEVVVPGAEVHEIVRPAGQTHRIIVREQRAVLAVLNTHLLGELGSIDADWLDGCSPLSAVTQLFRDTSSTALCLNDAPTGAEIVLIAPPSDGRGAGESSASQCDA